ncbi:HPF/RaiA family ribosome-associated protein [Varunaivibrio sulfuroxidans]|uniref:Ribosomal subunit interface protein n=1 Tax=Varunaivibrio sulfuroxidans TaxID=1773489 RepID=A0A4R3JEV3_9PROT|nr:HPF/RaiA family ribosome-associated protein [Varunaivibrio sulfuroxidans]TCS63656.1 ribosomal subunit interface protein [Varunaivibrio sulfuroxidans]WES30206.1 HPF/RaiA family ribosome-associated protein [Varunaivibrio sulfuroxidans]
MKDLKQIPVQVRFLNCDHSDALQVDIEARAQKLHVYHERITQCRVTVALPHKHHTKGALFEVGVDLVIPGTDPIIFHDPGANPAHTDPYLAVRDAFSAVERQLKSRTEKRRTKERQNPPEEIGL